MKRRTVQILFVVGLVLGVGLAAAATWTFDGTVSDGPTISVDNGPSIELLGSHYANLTDPHGPNSVTWNTSDGFATFSSAASTDATVSQLEGTYTKLQSVNASTSQMTIDPLDKSLIGVDGSASLLHFADAGINDGQTDLSLVSSSGVNVTFTGLNSTNETVYLVTGGSIAASTSTNSSGAATFSGLAAASQTDYSLAQSTGGSGSGPEPPNVNNSTAIPTNHVDVADADVNMRIDVSDPEIPNDELTVIWYVDKEAVGSKTYATNTTAEFEYTPPLAGNHAWYVEVYDSHNLLTTSDTFFFATTKNLTVRDETSNETLNNVSIDIRYFFKETADKDPLIVERTSTDGKINMSGLPGNRDFVAVARAEGYVNRRIWVSSLYQQDTIYLLNESTDWITNTFRLRDYSGDFPPSESVLQIQAPINETWKTVEGDYFGATGKFDAHLRRGVRHRLVLINPNTGERRVLGPFTPTRDGAEHIIEITNNGDPKLIDEGPYVGFRPGTNSVPELNATTVGVEIEPLRKNMSSYSVEWILSTSSGNTTLSTLSGSNVDGETLTTDLNLTNQSGAKLYAIVNFTTQDGESGVRSKVYSIRKTYVNKHNLLNSLARIAGAVVNGSLFTSLIAIFGSVFVGGISGARLRLSTEGIGLVMLGCMIGFGIVGWLGWPVVLIAGVVWLVASALRRGI